MRTPDIWMATDSGGMLGTFAEFRSAWVAPRRVDVWLPPTYASREQDRFPVLYMHDGQNLFVPELAFTGVDWGVDEAVARLVQAGATAGVIVVGLWNTEQRRREYMPQSPLAEPEAAALAASFAAENGGPPLSDAYLKCLVEEVKPLVDATWRTLPDRAHTWLMGSSMGGLVSLYGLSTHHDVFGAAACLSTHWTIGGDRLVRGLADLLPRPGVHRLYFDYGTETVDAGYEPFQAQFDHELHLAGYRPGLDWITRRFAGAAHNEAAWRARVDVPLAFLVTAQA